MQILDSISDVNDITYIPVGEAFNYIENSNSDFDLYMDDNKHPSPNGTYLIACVFYSMITEILQLDYQGDLREKMWTVKNCTISLLKLKLLKQHRRLQKLSQRFKIN